MNPFFYQAKFDMSAAALDQLPSCEGAFEVAFAGRSNAGKSSAINTLTNQKSLARTSKTPGRTQLINLFPLDENRRLVDLPGYGFAKAPRSDRQKWAELMNDYFRAHHSGGRPEEAPEKLLVQLIDSKVGATQLDVEAQEYFQHLGLAQFLVATKIDKLPRGKRREFGI